jgi:hypothetical protein
VLISCQLGQTEAFSANFIRKLHENLINYFHEIQRKNNVCHIRKVDQRHPILILVQHVQDFEASTMGTHASHSVSQLLANASLSVHLTIYMCVCMATHTKKACVQSIGKKSILNQEFQYHFLKHY